jgi:TonB family protein
MLRSRVGLEGEVEELRVDRGSGDHALDMAAMMVARGIRFRPALIEGFPVPNVWASFRSGSCTRGGEGAQRPLSHPLRVVGIRH